jgi:hypothetical protein
VVRWRIPSSLQTSGDLAVGWRAAGVGLAGLVAAVVFVVGGPAGLAYLALLALVTASGLPLGFALFGRRHAAGWIAGALFGYAAISLAWWAVVFLGIASTVAFVAAWAGAFVVNGAAALVVGPPAVALPEWSRRDTAALLLVLLLVPVLVWKPFAKLGAVDEAGDRQYRAYFIADFVWHTALTAELAKETQPPRNPYLASQPIHYYWTYFRVPATLVRHAGFDVQNALKVNAIGMALLMLASIYLAAWTALPGWPLAVAAAVALTVLAPSAEGLAAIVDLVRRGQPLAGLRDLNIDAIAAWAFKGLRIDDLPRAMWYMPQHSASYALGLLAMPAAIAGGVRAKPAAILLTGLALGASLAFNPLVGATFCAVYGLTIATDAVRTRAPLAALLRHALAVAPVLVAYAWCIVNQVGEGATAALHFGFWGLARNGTLIVFLLSFGPLLLLMAPGLWPSRDQRLAPLWPAIYAVVLGVLLMHFVALTVDQAWVGFRGGHILLVAAPVLVARGLLVLRQHSRRLAATAAIVTLAAGLPTTVIDAYNAQDVSNRHICCGPNATQGDFHWTVVVTAAEHEALDWIRNNTPPDAIVQMEPTVRGRETWSLIPSFAERRMASGNPIALLAVPAYAEGNAQVLRIYQSSDPEEAWRAAASLGIDYLYVDRTERAAYPNVAKFDAHPEHFDPVFRNDEVTVYAVRNGKSAP